jgi:ferredoxin
MWVNGTRIHIEEETTMFLVINGKCICCDVCLPECPNGAISAGEEIFYIDQKKCTLCVGFYDRPQCIEVCPVEAVDVVAA